MIFSFMVFPVGPPRFDIRAPQPVGVEGKPA